MRLGVQIRNSVPEAWIALSIRFLLTRLDSARVTPSYDTINTLTATRIIFASDPTASVDPKKKDIIPRQNAFQARNSFMEHDALDDPFDFDASIEDALRDSTPNGNNQATKEKPQGKNTNKETIEDLGITEEITVTKKRQPIAKLDETRLLSAAGIPKLRKITKGRTKFRGKGHEVRESC